MKNYKLISLAVTGLNGKLFRKSNNEVLPSSAFGGDTAADRLVEAGFLVEVSGKDSSKEETFDASKSKGEGMSVKKVKAHLETLNTVEEVDAFIDDKEDRSGVIKAVAKRKEELASVEGTEGTEGTEEEE